MNNSYEITQEEILFLTFNQDQECFVCGTNYGFKIYKTHPLKQTLIRDLGGGIALIELLYKSNLMALVGGGRNPKFPVNKVIIWDDYQGQVVGEITLAADAKIKAVRLRQHRLLVLTDQRIYIHNLQDLALLKRIDTGPNPKGLFCFSLNESIVCFPSKADSGTVEFLGLENNMMWAAKAHSTEISLMEMNYQGDKLATASGKGTIVRLFNVKDGTLIKELRRGTEKHNILSLQFSIDSCWLLCTSDSGTTHVFSIGKEAVNPDESMIGKKDAQKNNKKSKLSFLKVVNKYFDSEWSFCQFKLPDKSSKVAFLNHHDNEKLIAAISPRGQYYIISYENPNQPKVVVIKSFTSKIIDSTASMVGLPSAFSS